MGDTTFYVKRAPPGPGRRDFADPGDVPASRPAAQYRSGRQLMKYRVAM